MLLKEERQRQLAIKVSQGVTRREAYRRKGQQQCQKVQMSHRNPEIRHKSSQVLLFENEQVTPELASQHHLCAIPQKAPLPIKFFYSTECP